MDVDISKIEIFWSEVDFRRGTYRYEVTISEYSMPVAIAYVDRFGTENYKRGGSLTYCSVLYESLRRKGIATKLIEKIQEHTDIITTCSNEYSKGLLQKTNFIFSESLDRWVWVKLK